MFHFTFAKLALAFFIVVLVFGGMRLPGLRETFLREGEPRSSDARWSRTDWFLIGTAAVFGVLMLLVLSYVPGR